MKNNELRIGNYVQHKGEIVKVEQITKHKIGYHKYADKRTMQYLRYSEIEPIEITEYLLLKSGLEKVKVYSQENFISDNNDVLLSYFDDEDYWRAIIYFNKCTIGKNIKYIHELQNAYFVVNNKELEIKF